MGGGSWRLSCSAVISCTNQRPISKTRKHTHRRQARTKARTKGAQKHDRRHRKQKSTRAQSTRAREHESTRAKKHERAEGERDTLRSNHGRAAALPRITSLPMSLLLRMHTHAHIYRHAFVKSTVPVKMQLNSAMVHSRDEHALNCIGMSRALRQRPSERTAAHNRPAYVPHARGSLRAD